MKSSLGLRLRQHYGTGGQGAESRSSRLNVSGAFGECCWTSTPKRLSMPATVFHYISSCHTHSYFNSPHTTAVYGDDTNVFYSMILCHMPHSFYWYYIYLVYTVENMPTTSPVAQRATSSIARRTRCTISCTTSALTILSQTVYTYIYLVYFAM